METLFDTFSWVLIQIGLAFITMAVAEKRGRDKFLALGLGFLFGLFAMIGYLIAGNTKEKKIEIAKTLLK
jgi:hypothetical protein